MKTNLTKILVLTLSLVLLLGAVIGISVSAEEHTYEIEYMNIAHGDTTSILVAVDAPVTGTAPEGVTVTYVDAYGETLTAKYYGDLSVDGTVYPVYYTKGIYAKDLGQDVVATVTVGEEAKDTANVSVAEYLYGKLYKEGFINATEEKDLHKKNLYLNLIDYAASAETVLWNDKAENADKQRTLITDKFYVYAEGFGEDVLEPTETFTLNYTGTAPEGYAFTGYWVSTIDGTSVVADGVATTPTAHGVYEPSFYSTTTQGIYYASSTEGTRYDFTDALALDVAGENYADLSVYDAETNPNGLLANEFVQDNGYASFVTDKFSVLDNSTGKLTYTMNTKDWSTFSIANKGDRAGSTGDVYIFEADFTYEAAGADTEDGKPIYIGTTSNNGHNDYYHATACFSYTHDKNALLIGDAVLVKGYTYNIRIKYVAGDDGAKYQVFVDNVLVDETPDEVGKKADENVFAGLGVLIRQRHAGNGFSFSLDNVYMGNIDSYFADKTIEGTRYDFTDAITLEQYNAETAPNGIFAGAFTDDDTQAILTDKTLAITNTDGRLLVDMTKREWAGFTLANKGDTTGVTGSKYIIEFDFTYLSNAAYTGSGPDYKAFAFGVSSSGGALNSMIRYNNVLHKDNTYNTDLTFNSFVLEKGSTYKIRIESTVGGDELIYVDNVLIGTNVGAKGKSNDPTVFVGLGIYIRDKHAGAQFSFALDNVFMTTIDPQ